jgi:hypothetical protein
MEAEAQVFGMGGIEMTTRFHITRATIVAAAGDVVW